MAVLQLCRSDLICWADAAPCIISFLAVEVRQCEPGMIFLAVGYYLIAQFDQDVKFSAEDCAESVNASESILPEQYILADPNARWRTLLALRWLKNCWRETISRPIKRPWEINPKGCEAKINRPCSACARINFTLF
jgi:hypothetical protein